MAPSGRARGGRAHNTRLRANPAALIAADFAVRTGGRAASWARQRIAGAGLIVPHIALEAQNRRLASDFATSAATLVRERFVAHGAHPRGRCADLRILAEPLDACGRVVARRSGASAHAGAAERSGCWIATILCIIDASITGGTGHPCRTAARLAQRLIVRGQVVGCCTSADDKTEQNNEVPHSDAAAPARAMRCYGITNPMT